MRITGDMRKLLGQYELLGGRFRERFELWGLLGTMDILDELLTLFDDLRTTLERIDAEQEEFAAELQRDSEIMESNFPDQATIELFSAIRVLEEVFKTLERRAVSSNALERLHKALLALVHDSSPPGMLMPTQRTNGPIDSPATQIAKGMLAAAAHVRQKSKGVSRTEAASWVLRTTTS